MERKTALRMMLILLIFSVLFTVSNVLVVKSSGTVYIRADGSVDPPSAPIQRVGDVYTFTDDINDSIVIQRDNIVVDGNGYTLQGTGAGDSKGFDLSGRLNVTIKNTHITAFHIGIYLYYSSYDIVLGNIVTNITWYDIYLYASLYDNVSSNILSKGMHGIFLQSSSNNIVSGNNIINHSYTNIECYDSNHNIISGNIVANAGMDSIISWYSSYNTVLGNTVINNNVGIYLGSYAYYHNVLDNNVINNTVGFYLGRSSNLTLSGNIVANNKHGIYFFFSSYNTASFNNLTNNERGISFYSSSYNTISDNNVSNSVWSGIWLSGESSNNIIYGNNITNNDLGIHISDSSDNKFYHNNFINNTEQVSMPTQYPYIHVWDDGYPSGGNYWSDYAGSDSYSGPNQDQLGSDRIGDIPYAIDANNTDRYPFMNPWGPQAHDVAVDGVVPSKTVVGQGFSVRINVTVANQGIYTKTFNVTASANLTIIQTRAITLANGTSDIILFVWNTTGFAKGNYTICVNATHVTGETDTVDNTYTNGAVVIAMVGDVTGPTPGVPDGKVDIRDVAAVANLFGVNYPDPRYNPNYDLNGDLKIDIKDIAIVSQNFGKVDR